MVNRLSWQRLLVVIMLSVFAGPSFGTVVAWAQDEVGLPPRPGSLPSATQLGDARGESAARLIPVWQTETVDSTGDVGRFASLAVDSGNRIHIAYHDVTKGDLKYANGVIGNWSIVSVDSEEEAGMCASLVLDGADRPHIAYARNSPIDESSPAATTLIAQRYATKTAGGWQMDSFDPLSLPPPTIPYRYECVASSLALDGAGQPRVGYVRAYWGPPKSMMYIDYASRAGGVWQVDELESVRPYTWGDISLAVGHDDKSRAVIAGGGYGAGDLHYGSLQAGAWQWTPLAADSLHSYRAVLQLTQTDEGRVAYERYGDALFFARQVGTQWYTETIALGTFELTDMVLRSDEQPCIVYRTWSGDGTLRYACRYGSSWQSEIIVGPGVDARYGSLAFRQGDAPVVAYYDATAGDLRLARRELVPATHFAYLPVVAVSSP